MACRRKSYDIANHNSMQWNGMELTKLYLSGPIPKPNINKWPLESVAAIMVPSGDHLASQTPPLP